VIEITLFSTSVAASNRICAMSLRRETADAQEPVAGSQVAREWRRKPLKSRETAMKMAPPATA
jgi:hypothetical protein